jgi:hypothetical protein
MLISKGAPYWVSNAAHDVFHLAAFMLKYCRERGWRLLFWQLCCCPSASTVWVKVRVSLGECSPHVASLCCPLLVASIPAVPTVSAQRPCLVLCKSLRPVAASCCMLPSPPWCQVPRRMCGCDLVGWVRGIKGYRILYTC